MDKFTDVGVLLAFIALSAFSVIGLVEGGKSVLTSIKDGTKIWVATVASFVLSMVISIAVAFMGVSPIQVTGAFSAALATVWLGALTFAFIEVIGYNMIIKTGFTLFDLLVAWLKNKFPPIIKVGIGDIPANTPDAENQPVTEGGK